MCDLLDVDIELCGVFNKMFIYCRKHTVETCYNKHGFPRHLQRSGVPVANSEMNDSYNHKED